MKDYEIILRIETFDADNGEGVGRYEDKSANLLYPLKTQAPIARLKPVSTREEVRLPTGRTGEHGQISTTQADASCPSVEPSTISPDTAYSGSGPDRKTYKVSSGAKSDQRFGEYRPKP